ncbi:DMT family transporter [Pollutibacter soli]|uniref:DMT family transporter n=1 Tax=Pollutibacter soli TaxID=3034157 RepID=UPI00301352D7
MRTPVKAHLSVFLANLIFSVNFSVVKFITPVFIKPFGLNVIRVLVTSSLLWIGFLISSPEKKLEKKHMGRLILCAITGVTINQLLFIKGLSITYSTHASLLMLCTPVLITAIAFFMLRERINFFRILGLILGITGATLLIFTGERTGSGKDILFGDTLIMLNAISYSFYFVLAKPLLQVYTPVQIQRWVFTIGGILILPFGWNEFIAVDWNALQFKHWGALAFVVLGATYIAYLLNAYALQHLKASATGSYMYTQPFFAGLVAYFFLDEPFPPIKFVAALLIMAGVFLVNKKTTKPIGIRI